MNMVTREYVEFFYFLIMFIEILIRHRFEGNCGFPKKMKEIILLFVERYCL